MKGERMINKTVKRIWQALTSKRFMSIIVVAMLLASVLTFAVNMHVHASGESWLSGWNYRKSHVINHTAGAGTSYQVKVDVAFSAAPPASWFTVLPTNIPIFMTTDVSSNGTVFAGDNNYKIYKSTDSGVTFSNIYTIPAQPSPWGVHAGKVWTVFVDSRNYLLVSAGSTNRIYRSTDNGTSFTEVLNLNRSANDGMIISMTEDVSGNLYAAEYANVPPARLYKSTDGGATWSYLRSWDARHLHAVKFNPYNGWLYVVTGEDVSGTTEHQTVWRSKDSGNNWILIVARGNELDTKYLPIEFIGNDVFLGRDQNRYGDTPDIEKVTDDGVSEPFTPITAYDNPYPNAIMTAATKVGDTIIFTTSAESWTATCQVVKSDDGINWTVLHTEDVSPTYLWINELTIHPRKGIVYGCINHDSAYFVALPSTPRPPSLQPSQDIVSLEGHCKTDFGDVRFTDDDGNTLLDYWMETKVDGTSAVFWVKVADDLSSVDRTMYVYYGKSDATTTSNPNNTFLFFDDFNGGLSKWTTLSGTWAIEGGNLVIQPTAENNYLITSSAIGTNSIAIRTRAQSTQITPPTPAGAHPGLIWHANTATGTSHRNDQVYLRPHDTSPSSTLGNIQPAYYSGTGGYLGNGVNMHDGKAGSYYDWNNWYTLEVRIPPSGNVTLYGNDLSWHNWGNQSYSYDRIGLVAQTGGKDYFDYVAVRKYIEPEPTPSVWGSEEQSQFSLTLNVIGGGWIEKNPDQENYTYGTVVTLTAHANAGWAFDHWSVEASGTVNPTTVNMTYNKGVTVTFRTLEPTAVLVHPATTDATLGGEYTVYINITNVADLYAWEFQFNYNPAILDLTSTALVPGGLNEPTQTFYSLTDETAGHLWWAVSTTYPVKTGISYLSHSVFEIHFHAIGLGTSNLHLYGTIISRSNASKITHTTTDGSITVRIPDLIVASITVIDNACSIYANDTNAGGGTYYYPVEVTVQNVGNGTAASFHVKLEVYWATGSLLETQQELTVSGLSESASVVVNFTSLFHPTYTGFYRLTATVDSQNEIEESTESNNLLSKENVKVTVIGDVNNDAVVDILDGVRISIAWDSTPSDPWWNIKADLNHNGFVNILDATRASLHWGETA